MGDLIVIPARYGSKRLPGKPLIKIAGRTLLERVVNVARQAAHSISGVEIVVATDDARIEAHASAIGCAVAITSPDIMSGTARALAAARHRSARPDIVLNLQGDAPFVPPNVLQAILQDARIHPDAAVTTPVVRLGWEALDAMRAHKAVSPFSGTTCVGDAQGRALWFSKSIIPAIRNEDALRAAEPQSPVLRHLGVYAYRRDALERFDAAPETRHEAIEGLEQLRFLENGMSINLVEVLQPRFAMSGIDAPADIALAEAEIEKHGDPYRAL